MTFLRDRWRKNWPELRAALGRGLPHFVLAEKPADLGDCIPAFCYHTVEHETLEADLRFLQRNGYVAIDADALLDHVQRRRQAPTRAVVLSFDDGPRHLHQVVFPLIYRFRQRAVAFIAPAVHADGPLPDVPDRPCTWQEIREMHESGYVDFQSHTLEHRFLPRWPEQLPLTGIASRFWQTGPPSMSMQEDFLLAREAIERRLRKTVAHMAFPGFESTPAAVRAARACGILGVWGGLVAGQRSNVPGGDGTPIVRLSGEFVRRLPGQGRTPLMTILRYRYAAGIRRWVAGSVLA